tara:strand:- start:145 stop:2010 length:1866 start_codon:yes stop_codon:yes gene_type:complete
MLSSLIELKVSDRDYPRQIAQLLASQSWSQGCVIQVADGIRWVELGRFGDRSPGESQLQQSLESSELVGGTDWISFACGHTAVESPEQFCVAVEFTDHEQATTALQGVYQSILTGVIEWHRICQLQDRVLRSETILQIAAQWHGIKQTDQLITEIVEASTQLLDAERASLFLWDKGNQQLVARPALGIDGNELRVPDAAGVVGEVVHSGESLRIDEVEGQDQINRDVDNQLNFTTHNLICCPLKNDRDEIIGAFEVLNKRAGTFTSADLKALEDLADHIVSALQEAQEVEQIIASRSLIAEQAAEGVTLIGECPQIVALRTTLERIANTDLAVLILGENGTGKEVVSQLLHFQSDRRDEPLVAVNCAAISESLLESELFGHVQGAFTDARDDREGKFELASRGTLLLDEIGDMSLPGQAKLLRVLEDKVVVRVGGSTPIHTDARVIAATNQDLSEMVREKRFREDLFYRLNVMTVEMPPLRERGEDIILLAEHFLKHLSGQARRTVPRITSGARKKLLTHSWPGNVRELRNLIERIIYLSDSDKLEASDLQFADTTARGVSHLEFSGTLNEATMNFQIELIRTQIKRSGGNMTEVARQLGLHRSNLYRKMGQLGMSLEENS